MNTIFKNIRFALKVLIAIPKTFFWILFALIISPFQIAYHMSSAGREIHTSLDHGLQDQYYKRAIALIELYKVRFDVYPVSLEEDKFLEYAGDWDGLIHQKVQYTKLESGYELNLNEQDSQPLEYPLTFWKGLGIVETNVTGFHISV